MHEPGDYRIGTALAQDRDPAAGAQNEPLFLDEAEVPVTRASAGVTPSALDLFPDEEETLLTAAVVVPSPAGPAPDAALAGGKGTRLAPVIALFLLAAAFAFGAVRACQIGADVAAAGFVATPSR